MFDYDPPVGAVRDTLNAFCPCGRLLFLPLFLFLHISRIAIFCDSFQVLLFTGNF